MIDHSIAAANSGGDPAPIVVERRQLILGNGAQLEYDQCGEETGECVLLLHGLGASAASFYPLMQFIGASWTSIAWNAPGFGLSSNVHDNRPTVTDYVNRLEELVDGLSLSRAHVVGQGWGALIGAAFAHRHPNAVASLALVSPSVGLRRMDEEERHRHIEQRINDLRTGLPAWAEAQAPLLLAPTASPLSVTKAQECDPALHLKGLEQATHMEATADPIKDLAQFNNPVMAVYGARDQLTPVRFGDEFLARVPHLRLELIEDCGHLPLMERPEQMTALLQSHWSYGEGTQACARWQVFSNPLLRSF